MTRFNIPLLVALVLSSLYLVRTAYDSRRLFAELDKSKNEAARLDTEFKRLEAEREAQATSLRVERTAREKRARTLQRAHFKLFGFSSTPSLRSSNKA